jgi:hypothetical protein
VEVLEAVPLWKSIIDYSEQIKKNATGKHQYDFPRVCLSCRTCSYSCITNFSRVLQEATNINHHKAMPDLLFELQCDSLTGSGYNA